MLLILRPSLGKHGFLGYDKIFVNPDGRLITRNFFNLFNGSIFKERKVLTLTDSEVKISAKNGDLVCQGDGEIFGAGKIDYSVIKKGLRYLS